MEKEFSKIMIEVGFAYLSGFTLSFIIFHIHSFIFILTFNMLPSKLVIYDTHKSLINIIFSVMSKKIEMIV